MRSPLAPGPAGEIRDWPRIGGHLALDLANTVSWRLDPQRRVDYLATTFALADWLRVVDARPHDILSPGPTGSGESVLHDVRALRDATIAVLDAQVDGAAAPDASLEVVAGYGQRAIAASSLRPGLPSRWVCEVDSPADLIHHLALVTVTLLQSESAGWIRRCEGPGCGWFFLDTTRNHSRRWCASGDCGNRVRVRNYTQRRRHPTAT